METTTKKWKTENTKKWRNDILRSISKQSGESWSDSWRRKGWLWCEGTTFRHWSGHHCWCRRSTSNLKHSSFSTHFTRAYSKEFFGVHNFKSSCMMECTNSIQSNNKLELTSWKQHYLLINLCLKNKCHWKSGVHIFLILSAQLVRGTRLE